ncbi:MAG: hypothetical protein WCT51_03810 [Candidatus Shapirobacteria bacterium]|jgi:hypothetical protein
MTITYISTPSPVMPKPLYVIYLEDCYQLEPKPIFCELPDDLGNKKQSLKFLSNNLMTASGTVSGASTSTIQLGLQYDVKGEK